MTGELDIKRVMDIKVHNDHRWAEDTFRTLFEMQAFSMFKFQGDISLVVYFTQSQYCSMRRQPSIGQNGLITFEFTKN